MIDKVVKLAGLPGSPAHLVGVVGDIALMAKEYAVVREQEVTKREEIAARRDVAIEHIRGHRDVLIYVFEKTFAERAVVLTKQFEALDAGLAAGDARIIEAALDAIVDVIQTSPVNIEQLREVFTTPGRVLELS